MGPCSLCLCGSSVTLGTVLELITKLCDWDQTASPNAPPGRSQQVQEVMSRAEKERMSGFGRRTVSPLPTSSAAAA